MMNSNKFLLLTANMIFHDIVFQNNMNYAYIASNNDKLNSLREEILRLYDTTSIPKEYLPKITRNNKCRLEFGNHVNLFMTKFNPSCLRGYSINAVYIDEVAVSDDDVEHAIYPSIVSASGKMYKNG